MLQRFSVSLEQGLLAKFDAFLGARGYRNRSEAVRDLIRGALVREEWAGDKEVMAVITLVYDHHQRQLQERMTEIQHDFHQQIVSTTHVHVDHDNCLEVIIVHGKAVEVRRLTDLLVPLRGVRDANLAMSSTGKNLG